MATYMEHVAVGTRTVLLGTPGGTAQPGVEYFYTSHQYAAGHTTVNISPRTYLRPCTVFISAGLRLTDMAHTSLANLTEHLCAL